MKGQRACHNCIDLDISQADKFHSMDEKKEYRVQVPHQIKVNMTKKITKFTKKDYYIKRIDDFCFVLEANTKNNTIEMKKK